MKYGNALEVFVCLLDFSAVNTYDFLPSISEQCRYPLTRTNIHDTSSIHGPVKISAWIPIFCIRNYKNEITVRLQG